MEAPRTVLVAMDRPEIHSFLCSALTPDGYFVRHARHWITALNFAREIPPRIVVLDYEMKNLELDLFLNQIGRLKNKTEIIVIGDTDEKFGAKIAPYGFQYFFPKPLNCELLVRTIRGLTLKVPQRIRALGAPFYEAANLSPAR